MLYKITPIAKPRMTYRDSGKSKMNRAVGMRPVVARYWAFVQQVQLQKVELKAGATIIFHMPMPESWSERRKKRYNRTPHKQKPDLSNLLKALEDAVHKDDSHLWQYMHIAKYWMYEGAIQIINP